MSQSQKRRLVLHVGLHKTGTTTIQYLCALNVQALRKAGFLYPLARRDGGGRDANHSKLLGQMFPGPVARNIGPPDPDPEEIRDSVRKALQPGRANVLLIAEECSRFSFERLQQLREFFEELGFEIHVVCTIRKPMQWLNSMTGQAVIGNRSRRLPIAHAIGELVHEGGVVLPRLRNIQSVFPNAIISSFGEAISHPGGPCGHFLSQVGLRARFAGAPAAVNEGRSDASVRVADEINRRLGWRFASPRNDRLYTDLPTQCPVLYELPGPKFFLRADEIQPLLRFLQEENKELKARFGPGFYDEEIELRHESTDLDAEHLALLSRHVGQFPAGVREVVNKLLLRYSAR